MESQKWILYSSTNKVMEINCKGEIGVLSQADEIINDESQIVASVPLSFTSEVGRLVTSVVNTVKSESPDKIKVCTKNNEYVFLKAD